MKKITINTPFDKPDATSRKARLISIINNKVLVCNYSGFYMLPGGKLDDEETFDLAITREIFEETGNIITEDDYDEYLTVENYQTNYISRHKPERLINKKTITKYYITTKKIDSKEAYLSPLEKSGNMRLAYMDIDVLKSLLKQEVRPKHQVFAAELLSVLNEYESDHKIIDLHTHTTFSDGEYTPHEVINQARDKNIGTIAITDHDNIDALKDINYSEFNDITIIPGVELSAKVSHGRMHILGYLIDYYNKELNNFLDTMHTNSINKLKNIVAYLRYIGIIFKEEELNAIYNKRSNIGRPDIANLLIKHGYAENIKDAFDKYLIEAFDKTRINNVGYNYEQVLNIIAKSNGISILAHPSSLELNHEEFEDLLKDMIRCGLMGLEVFHPNVSLDDREYYMDMVNKYKLLYSVGSDYHGEKVKSDISLGSGRGDLKARDASILEYIKKANS